MVGRGETDGWAHPGSGDASGSAPSDDGSGPERTQVVFLERYSDPTSAEGARLPACPESVDLARRLTTAVLESWGLSHFRQTADRLVGELAGNAVKHTGGRWFGLHLIRRGGWVRFEIRDASRALPCLIAGGPQDSAGGLALVEELSDRWGADLLPRGKGVWFELRLR